MVTAAPATQSVAAALRAQQLSSAALPSAAPAASVHQPAAFVAAVLTTTAAFGDGSDNPASGGEQHTVSRQQRGEKGVRERDSEWYSGGDPEGSSGDILCSGDTAVTDSGGGLMVGTGGMCNGCTEMAGSNSTLGSSTGGVHCSE